ncbi:substrate-binding domain-containing protein [Streptomyces sp. 5-6(2022)]|uniref:substrate-binding domain-containing protein n=1 Tax=Streptomyces sp. 5-6(2022) TaxID=2936510 RepID=UPI0023BA26A8|nr:substrate-binding domain-containing protein [Streptomyces sp. 5-6(2022)]
MAQIDVPERISVLGFDDQLMAEWLDLSTVAQSPSDMGRAAGELALKLINDSEADREQHVVLPTHLIPRGTTARHPALRASERPTDSRMELFATSFDERRGARLAALSTVGPRSDVEVGDELTSVILQGGMNKLVSRAAAGALLVGVLKPYGFADGGIPQLFAGGASCGAHSRDLKECGASASAARRTSRHNGQSSVEGTRRHTMRTSLPGCL